MTLDCSALAAATLIYAVWVVAALVRRRPPDGPR